MTVWLSARTKVTGLFFLLLLGFGSCKKDTALPGADFISSRNGFQIGFDTTLQVRAYAVPMDSVVTSRLTSYALGAMNDPYLGITRANLITQIGLPGNQFSWQGATKLDSAVLQLRFRNGYASDGSVLPNFYGKQDAVHEFRVYLLKEDLSIDSIYYSTRSWQADAVSVGSFSGKINYTDTVKVMLGSETMTLLPHIRIPMNSTFLDQLLQGEQKGYFASDAVFKKQFKGLVVVDESNPAPDGGGFAYLNMSNVTTSLVAYYKDSLAAAFPIKAGFGGNEVAYNNYVHSSVPAGLIQHAFTGQHRDTGYAQPFTGTKLRVEIPGLFTFFSNPRVALNGAEIVFTPISGTFNDPYTLPASLSLVGSDSLGRNTFLRDQIFESYGYYGGTLSNNQYRFRVVRHLQDMLDQYRNGRNVNYGMNLIVRADDPLTAQRVVLDTRKGTASFRLKLTYTYVNP